MPQVGGTISTNSEGVVLLLNNGGVAVAAAGNSSGFLSGGAVPATPTDGHTNVTTAGTAVALAASTPCSSVTITALSGNTGTIAVGASTVLAAVGATRRGIPLNAGDSVSIPIANVSTLFIDSTVNGEGVSWLSLL